MKHLAVAVSGGSDSMALLRLAHLWAKPQGIQISALTVDHGFRPEAVGEAAKVRGWAQSLGVPHQILVWQGEKPKTGLQAKARAARYGLMSAWCRAHEVDGLMTGHTMNDQAETVVMRMKRTNSPDSIAAIRPVMDWEGIKILRPLLSQKRETLRAFLNSLDQGWVEDPSNENMLFERVRVRKELDGKDPAALAGKAEAALEESTENINKANYLLQSVKVFSEGFFAVQRNTFADPVVADVVVKRLIRSLGGNSTEKDEREKLISWCNAAENTRRTLGGVLVSQRQRDILFMREPGRIAFAPERVPDDGTLVWDGRFVISAEPGSMIAAACRLAGIQLLENIPRVVFDGLPAVVFKSKKPQLAHLLTQSGLKLSFPAKPLILEP
jgi:tRNA(Ile)-lysidine synthase